MAPHARPKLLTIKEAAEILGVAEVTLRRWDATGRFKAPRHPMSNYGVYPQKGVLRLRRRIENGKAG